MKIKNFLSKCEKFGVPLKNIKKIEKIIKSQTNNLYMVGGVVRGLILNEKNISHPDLVCNVPINQITKELKANKINFSSVGIDYGSIVIKDGGYIFDLTSTRKDLKSHGRYADIEFTGRLEDDSERRDFSINSIYCDLSGNLFDPQNGIRDLTKYKYPKIRFIGSASKRINEDFLRILRFLRFSIIYSNNLNYKYLNLCKKFKKKLLLLSFERRISEIKKIIIHKNFENNSKINKLSSFIEISLECSVDFENFLRLCKFERKINDVSFERRIKFLLRHNNVSKIKFINKIDKFFRRRLQNNFQIKKFSINNLYHLYLKKTDKDLTDLIIFGYADKKLTKTRTLYFLNFLNKIENKKFPLNGKDLMKIGFVSNKLIGTVIEKVNMWWFSKNLLPQKRECLLYAKRFLPTSTGR